jgi:hypothetical protein
LVDDLEPARLAHQRPDDVPVVDAMPVTTARPLAGQLDLVGVPNLDSVLEDPDSCPLALSRDGTE